MESYNNELLQNLQAQANSASLEERVNFMMGVELGISAIIPHMIKKLRSGCLLVGHNMLYDILFFYHQFIAELPETLEDFIESWKRIVPQCLDTKVQAGMLKKDLKLKNMGL